ncbi:hypothetical protein DevBK_20735 [Devosia sp. BK]|uniref:hypothetical protein n=1 Tax=Devosia sp. BK TaxID=2871706 RepID=UPI00293B44C3|nr:hypothetical protein [Devosia sp. BK]MDV3253775.1 hypothetical protein [Devosia sp. BK]
MLVAFLEKHLKVEIDTRGMFTITANDRRYREFVGKARRQTGCIWLTLLLPLGNASPYAWDRIASGC